MHPLEAIFGGGEQREERKTEPTILAHTLREVYANFSKPCPFSPGDLVMPRPGMAVSGAGRPHVVLEVYNEPIRPAPSGKSSDMNFNARLDMRVAHEMSEHIMAHCVESWMYETYVPTVAQGEVRN